MVMDVRQRTTWHGDSRQDEGSGFEGVTWLDTSWHGDGACSDTSVDFFVREDSTNGPSKLIETAKAVCFTCPVQQECLQHALDVGEEYGVWGGASEAELRIMRRQVAAGITPSAPLPPLTAEETPWPVLSDFEVKVLELALLDYRNDEIAAQIGTSVQHVTAAIRRASKRNGYSYEISDFLDQLHETGRQA